MFISLKNSVLMNTVSQQFDVFTSQPVPNQLFVTNVAIYSNGTIKNFSLKFLNNSTFTFFANFHALKITVYMVFPYPMVRE